MDKLLAIRSKLCRNLGVSTQDDSIFQDKWCMLNSSWSSKLSAKSKFYGLLWPRWLFRFLSLDGLSFKILEPILRSFIETEKKSRLNFVGYFCS